MNRQTRDVLRCLRSVSGQAMLIAVFILLILVVSIPTVSYLNQARGRHDVSSQARARSRNASIEGLNFAMATLADTTTWNAAMTGAYPTGFDGSQFFSTPQGSRFRIQLSQGSPSYYVQALTTGYSFQNGAWSATSATKALVAPKRLGASLLGSRNVAAAVQLASIPQVNGTLDVHWGAIVCLQTSGAWSLTGNIEAYRYPRKFAQCGLTGSTYSRAPNNTQPRYTDQKEYWAYTMLGFAPVIDFAAYQSSAATAGIGNSYSSYSFSTNESKSSAWWYFIGGNASMGKVSLDLKPTGSLSGALLVNGSLTLNSNTGALGGIFNVRVPPHAADEYPYASFPSTTPPLPYSAACVPADGSVGSCTIPRADFRGFVYVANNLHVTAGNWVIVGALRVDGQLQIDSGASLTIYYDDEVNHGISTLSLDLQAEYVQDVAP